MQFTPSFANNLINHDYEILLEDLNDFKKILIIFAASWNLR